MITISFDAKEPMSGCLWFSRSNRNLLTQNVIEQSRFTGISSTYYRNVS